MAKLTNMLKKVFLLLLCSFIYSQADEPNKFEAGNEWGWGSATTKQAEPTDKKPVEIPYFDQDLPVVRHVPGTSFPSCYRFIIYHFSLFQRIFAKTTFGDE